MKIDWDKLPKYVNLSEVSKILGVHTNTLRSWDQEGRFKAVRLGSRQDRKYEKEKLIKFYYQLNQEKASFNKKRLVFKWGFLSAGLVLIIGIGIGTYFFLKNRTQESEDLKVARVSLELTQEKEAVKEEEKAPDSQAEVKEFEQTQEENLPVETLKEKIESPGLSEGQIAGVSQEEPESDSKETQPEQETIIKEPEPEKQLAQATVPEITEEETASVQTQEESPAEETPEQTEEEEKDLKKITKPEYKYQGSTIGYFFTIISLFFGGIFFLYSLKYYFSVAVVLGFSRNGNGNNRNGNGRISRFFNGNNKSNNSNGRFSRFFNRNGNGNGFFRNNKNGNKKNGRFNGFFRNGFLNNNNHDHKKGFRNGYNGLKNHQNRKLNGKTGFFYRLFFGNGNGKNNNGNGNGRNNNGNGNGRFSRFFNGNNKNNNGNGSRFSRFFNANGKNNNGNGRFSRFFLRNGNNKNGLNNNGKNGSNGQGMWWALDELSLRKQPFISVHLPFYNEKKVANRILTACTSFDYRNYEVIVADDSNDETVKILERWKKHPKVKVLHRKDRSGFKGGALREAMKIMNPKTEFIVIFDADFVPYPDTLTQFLKYFNVTNGNGNNNKNHNHNNLLGDYKKSNVAAVQGYQWHVLNKNENWVTKAVRSEFAGSYVIERPGTEIIGSIKMIAGSVYMIRSDILKKYGWGTSITEDFELTLKIYADGYRVLYTPYIQGPSECVSTLKRLIRQRMRWAEGHTFNIRKYFKRIISSPHLRIREKLEFLYLSPYYLQACFFLIGTISWFISDAILHTHLPFWTALWGWSLVFTNMFALPLLNSVGLFLEESDERDYLGVFSFVILSYVMVPFQAYAAFKGLFEKEEGGWFRTPKSGHITDTFFRAHFRRWFGALFPGAARKSIVRQQALSQQYLKMASANNQFKDFKIKKRSRAARLIKNSFIFFLVGTTALISYFSTRVFPDSYSQTKDLSMTMRTIGGYEDEGQAREFSKKQASEKLEIIGPHGQVIELDKDDPENAEKIGEVAGEESDSSSDERKRERREEYIGIPEPEDKWEDVWPAASNPTTEYYLINSEILSGSDLDEEGTDLSTLYSNGGGEDDEDSMMPDSPWEQVNTDGFGSSSNTQINDLFSYNSYLYITVYNSAGFELWRCSEASECDENSDFSQVNTDGFGDSTNTQGYMFEFSNNLYVGTQNTIDGGELWMCTQASGCDENSDFSQVNTDGFGVSTNISVFWGYDTGSFMYVGTRNTSVGGDVYRCTTASGCDENSDFSNVVDNGFEATTEINMYVQEVVDVSGTDYLYVATQDNSNGGSIWRCDISNCDAEADFSEVITNGFGDSGNTAVVDVAEINGFLYASVAIDAEIWRCNISSSGCDAQADWSQVNTDGFGDTNNSSVRNFKVYEGNIYVATYNTTTFTEAWRCPLSSNCDANGDWEQINEDGFSDSNNAGAVLRIELLTYNFSGFIYYGGRDNTNGAPLYRYAGHGRAKDTSINFNSTTLDYWWYSRELPAYSASSIDIPAGTYSFDYYQSANSLSSSDTVTINVDVGYCNDDGSSSTICDENSDYTRESTGTRLFDDGETTNGLYNITLSDWSTAKTCTSSDPCRLYVNVSVTARGGTGATTMGYNGMRANYISHLNLPSMEVPENWLIISFLIIFFPLVIRKLRRKYAYAHATIVSMVFMVVILSHAPFGSFISNDKVVLSQKGIVYHYDVPLEPEKGKIKNAEYFSREIISRIPEDYEPIDNPVMMIGNVDVKKQEEQVEADEVLTPPSDAEKKDKSPPKKLIKTPEPQVPEKTKPPDKMAKTPAPEPEKTLPIPEKNIPGPEKLPEPEQDQTQKEPVDGDKIIPTQSTILKIENQDNKPEKPELIFHQEPRVRVKHAYNELEFKTFKSDGLGEVLNNQNGFKRDGQSIYPEIFKDVDLRYTMVHDGLLEEFIVHKPKEVKSISQELNLYDLEMVYKPGSEPVFVDNKTKEEKFRFHAPKMYELNQQGEQSEGLYYDFEKINNSKYVVNIVIDEEGQEWLMNPERNYPIVIDPSTVYSGTIADTDVDFGGQQQKLVFVNSAWYAFHNDGGRIGWHKCTDVTNKCDQDADWSSITYMGDGGDSDNEGPDTWLDGNYIWVTWLDNSGDDISIQSIDTSSSDSLGTACSSGDLGKAGTGYSGTISRGSNGDFLVTYPDGPQIYEVTGVSGANCTSETWTDRSSGSGMASKKNATATAVGNVIHLVWQEAGGTKLRHNYFDVSSTSWGTEVQVSADTTTSFGLVADSSGNLWVHYAESGNTASAVYKCAATCTGTWSSQTAPWSSETNLIYATITYASTEDDIIVSVIKDTSEQAYHNSSDVSSISWGTEYSYGFSAGDLGHVASMEEVSSAANAAVIVRESTTSIEFATVPENNIPLILFALILPLGIRWFLKRRRKKVLVYAKDCHYGPWMNGHKNAP